MSKQRRPPSRQEATPAQASGREAETLNEQLHGNQAVAQQVDGAELAVGEERTAHDEACTLVERGYFALYAEPRPPAQLEKWVRVLEGSKLPTDRKVALVDKLVGDQEAATAARDAAERWFGGPGLDAQAAGLQALDVVWDGLKSSETSERLDHAVSPESLIGDLAGDAQEAVIGFCREVYLILGFQEDEEEEEEEGGELPPGIE